MIRFCTIVLCLLTLSACQSAESLKRERNQQAWEDSLTNDQKIRLEAARLQALGLALSGGPIFKAPSTHYDPPMIQTGPRLNCYTNQIGASTYTNCY